MLVTVPIYDWITTNYARRRFVPWVYAFSIANILMFYWFFTNRGDSVWVARVFFVWVSVFNLFVVSVVLWP